MYAKQLSFLAASIITIPVKIKSTGPHTGSEVQQRSAAQHVLGLGSIPRAGVLTAGSPPVVRQPCSLRIPTVVF